MHQTYQNESHIVRLLSLASQSSANATIQCSLIEASLMIERLDPNEEGVAHFVDEAFAINIALLKGLDTMVYTDYEAVNQQVAQLRGYVESQQRDLNQPVHE
ncbi:hypothetical protein [Lacticaseibacillus saniviri]|uniref:Uncharacterized protein n=1 Tax=Lacticaseibacillus saniviri JCM 17471 = DSM 24301 TaxID=1293598 RepID=A0A0R2MV41_9LACO|nr:hypothetical protein [Lacticaseibacillus saniviri]KRO17273.1 hypothetical protein IV56_GL000393 [Lacticaseibacillus saniviri JCM 17471 = DSM 24301]MCG4282432.1 hypothetical protein [Lacticaseibacillus saniviri]